jgi:hypothetical protein
MNTIALGSMQDTPEAGYFYVRNLKNTLAGIAFQAEKEEDEQLDI